ncbi:alpha/beta hydrolase [Pseudonocardia sp. RS11V-5]|uniref:alpha/beta fold hydrolase n=1 Tax=Pseudonocardia terrae TaxID=2905831 RepID=UPI001E4E0D5C|nr:alpha/beta hydrolase [Pseudonocardia terrae]MCE3553221.1 alpha/beta hydrolase [Pseudonocardia terrae]
MTVLERVRSADGTEIALEQVTDGPRRLLLVPGGPAGRGRWARTAALLDGHYACWLMDRRGKGDSGDTLPYAFAREFEDVRAAAGRLASLGPLSVGANSSGASVVLGAAAAGGLPVAELFLYEPPWPVDGPLTPPATIDALDVMITDGDRAGAVARALTEVVGVPAEAVAGMRVLPTWPERVALVHTWTREMREVDRLPGIDALAAVDVPVLMLLGEHSPDHMRRATTAIAAALPRAAVVDLAGQGHGALDEAPSVVAGALLAHLAPS